MTTKTETHLNKLINVRENQRGLQEWAIQRYRKHWPQDTKTKKRAETKKTSNMTQSKTMEFSYFWENLVIDRGK